MFKHTEVRLKETDKDIRILFFSYFSPSSYTSTFLDNGPQFTWDLFS